MESEQQWYGRGRGRFEKGLLWNNRESVTHQTWDDMDNRQFNEQNFFNSELKKLKKTSSKESSYVQPATQQYLGIYI